MHKLKSNDRAKVKQFMSLANCPEKVAIACLAQNDWKLEPALGSFFDNADHYQTRPTIDRRRIEGWFYKYSQNTDKIQIEGCVQLLNDLQLQPNDRKVLILAHKLRAQTQCEFTKQEFVVGMADIGCDSTPVLSQRLVEFENELTQDLHKIRELYSFAWSYGKPPETKSMDWETAVEYWNILLHSFVDRDLLRLWIEFVSNHGKAVTKDTWNLLLEFVTSVEPSLANYDFDGAWPTMIDDFVVWARERLKANHNQHNLTTHNNNSSHHSKHV